VGAKQPARTTARKQVAPVSKEHQEPVWAAGAPTPGVFLRIEHDVLLSTAQPSPCETAGGRALRRSRAPAQAEQSTTRVSMNAATWEVPRHAACHPQTGCIRNWRDQRRRGQQRSLQWLRWCRWSWVWGNQRRRHRRNGFLPSGLVLYSYAGCAGEVQPNPNDPCGCPICVPKPDAGIVKDAGSPDGPIGLGPPPPCALPPRPVPLGRSWSLRLRLHRMHAGGRVEPATLGNQTRR